MATHPVRVLSLKQLIAPRVIPKQANQFEESAPAPDIGIASSVGGTEGLPNGVLNSIPAAPVAPAPQLLAPAEQQGLSGPLPIGGKIAEANLIRRVQPVYPPLARAARVQGTVIFRALISKEGTIQNLQYVRGPHLLVNAARQAILQWRYKPTLLNGRPVEVVTEITVKFVLSQ